MLPGEGAGTLGASAVGGSAALGLGSCGVGLGGKEAYFLFGTFAPAGWAGRGGFAFHGGYQGLKFMVTSGANKFVNRHNFDL